MRPALPRAHPIRSGAGFYAKGGKDEGKHEGKARGEVREVLEDGLRRADGAEYRGTRAEVSAAALLPSERRMLADGLRILRMVGFQDPNERRELCMASRREAIARHGRGYVILGSDAATEVMIEAAARHVGVKVAELKRRAILSEIEAILDADGEFPLTRRERLALEATGKKQSDFCTLMKLRGKLGL